MCEDAWLTTAALLAETERIKFLVAFRPGLVSPTLAAQMASTYQRMSGGRLLMNVVTGADTEELARFGDWLDHDERYARTGEFLDVLRGAWSGEPFDFEGDALPGARGHHPGRARPDAPRSTSGARRRRPSRWRRPRSTSTWPGASRPRWSPSGSSGCAARGRAGAHAAVRHPLPRDHPRHAARRRGPRPSACSTSVPDAAVAAAQADFARTQSVGQQRMASLHGDGRDRAALEIAPERVGRRRPGAGRGRHRPGRQPRGGRRRASRSTAAVGFDEFILSGYPHLEEAYWFGENVMPILRRRGVLTDGGPGDPATDGQAEPLATFR